MLLLLLLSCAAGKGGAPTADDIPDDELAEDIYAGEEDELRPERPDKVRGADNLLFFLSVILILYFPSFSLSTDISPSVICTVMYRHVVYWSPGGYAHAEDIYAGEEDELRPERPDTV
jgi:hypothetical protein